MLLFTRNWNMQECLVRSSRLLPRNVCNKPLWNDYMWCMVQYSLEQLGFLYETSKNDKTPGWQYGRGRKGRWAQMKQVFVWGCWLSAEGPLTVEGIVASTVVEGLMKCDGFLHFLENQVVHPWLLLASSSAKHVAASTLLSFSWTTECPHYGQHAHSPWQWNCGASWPTWYVGLFDWKSLTYYCRCLSHIFPSLFSRFSRLQSHWGSILKNQSMDPSQQWHLFSCNRGGSNVWHARGYEHSHRIRCNWLLYTCRLFLVLPFECNW